MSVEVRESSGVGMVGGGIDPSNLHLKKELTQIRRAARVLRDPGTSSSWRSPPPLGSARSLTKHHYVHHQKNGHIEGNATASSSDHLLRLPLKVENNNSCSNADAASEKGSNQNEREKVRRVFLYNWRNHKSGGERSRQIVEDDVENGIGNGSSYTREESLDKESLINVQSVGVNDSKSDGYLSDRYSSSVLKCLNSNFSPSIRRTIKKKSKRSNYSSASSRYHKEKLQMKMLLSRYAKNVSDSSPSLSLGRDDLQNLAHQSDDTEDYCRSEDLVRGSAISPLLVRIRKKGWSRRNEEDSFSHSTRALSTSSYNRYAIRHPRAVESWDAMTGSLNEGDGEVDDQLDLPGRHGCGIPCYWSRRSTPKSRTGSSCSPSLSDTLRRKGSGMFCGSQTLSRSRHHCFSSGSNKKRLSCKTAAESLIPLLDNESGTHSDDELSTNLSELDLEGLSRLDGRRWSSSCRSQEGLESSSGLKGEVHEECSPENMRSLSHKYRPMFFDELIGQNILIQSLTSAIARGRIAPVYLFLGPRGIGKTSTARIFAAALNCLATEETKPCGVCRECADFISSKSEYLEEVNGSNKKGIERLKNLIKKISVVHSLALPCYKVFVIDQCHLLPSKTWLAFLQLLEKPLPHIIFILTTTDIDNVPRTLLTCCQKHIFNKISSGDIVARLRKICIDEGLDVESNALELIASSVDGSLGDAETMLDQLSLFGKRITKSLVNELMGVVSDEKLLDLLELAMSSNATETVLRARELMDSGADPLALVSQLVTLIVNIIAGTYRSVDSKLKDLFFGGRTLSERELERLKHALVLLSEAEKHLRVSRDRSMWFTATLLQLGSVSSPDRSLSISSRRQSSKATEEDRISMSTEATASKQRTDGHLASEKLGSPTCKEKQVPLIPKPNRSQFTDGEEPTVSRDDTTSGTPTTTCLDSKMLTSIWLQCIDKCHSKTLRQLLHSYGKLVSISEIKGRFVAQIGFEDSNIKTRAEGFLSSITNSFEVVLRCNVEVKIVLLQDSSGRDENPTNLEIKSTRSNILAHNSDLYLLQDPLKISRGSFNVSEGHQSNYAESITVNANINSSEDMKSDVPLRRIESIIHEQRLETAWLQATDKGTPQSISHLKPERNQVLPQDGIDHPNQMEPVNSLEGGLDHEIKVLKINDETAHEKDQIVKKIDHCPISPSLLHSCSIANNLSKDNAGYESGSGAGGCSGMFCWNNRRPHRRGKGKQPKNGRFSIFGECAK